MFESKQITTTVKNGKKIVTGAVWKWGPLFNKVSQPSNS